MEHTRVECAEGALERFEARIDALQRALSFANDTPSAAPTVERAMMEAAEKASRPARGDARAERLLFCGVTKTGQVTGEELSTRRSRG